MIVEGFLDVSKVGLLRDLPLLDGLAAYQLVGEVTAHQGYDG